MTPLQIAGAVDVLRAAGWRLVPPAVERLRLLRSTDVAEILGVSQKHAQKLLRSMPGAVRLPGDDLRVSRAGLMGWIEQHRISAGPADVTKGQIP